MLSRPMLRTFASSSLYRLSSSPLGSVAMIPAGIGRSGRSNLANFPGILRLHCFRIMARRVRCRSREQMGHRASDSVVAGFFAGRRCAGDGARWNIAFDSRRHPQHRAGDDGSGDCGAGTSNPDCSDWRLTRSSQATHDSSSTTPSWKMARASIASIATFWHRII